MIKGVNMKKKFSVFDFIISIVFTFAFSFFLLPQSMNFFITKQDKISKEIKEQMLLAGKSYLENNKDKRNVSLSELFNSGYLMKDNVIPNKECFPSISTVSIRNGTYYLNLQCVDDNSKLTLLE
jgi:hypothetical protein